MLAFMNVQALLLFLISLFGGGLMSPLVQANLTMDMICLLVAPLIQDFLRRAQWNGQRLCCLLWLLLKGGYSQQRELGIVCCQCMRYAGKGAPQSIQGNTINLAVINRSGLCLPQKKTVMLLIVRCLSWMLTFRCHLSSIVGGEDEVKIQVRILIHQTSFS